MHVIIVCTIGYDRFGIIGMLNLHERENLRTNSEISTSKKLIKNSHNIVTHKFVTRLRISFFCRSIRRLSKAILCDSQKRLSKM